MVLAQYQVLANTLNSGIGICTGAEKGESVRPSCLTKTLFPEKHSLYSVQRPLKGTNRGDGNSLAAHKLLTYGGEVHRFLDDLLVAGD